MVVFVLIALVCAGLLASAARLTARALALPRSELQSVAIYRPPRSLGLIAVVGMACVCGGILLYALFNLHTFALAWLVSLYGSAVIAAGLSWLMAVEFARAQVIIDGSRLVHTSLGRHVEVDLSDVVQVLSSSGHIGLKLASGKVALISGGFGNNAELRAHLELAVQLNRREAAG